MILLGYKTNKTTREFLNNYFYEFKLANEIMRLSE